MALRANTHPFAFRCVPPLAVAALVAILVTGCGGGGGSGGGTQSAADFIRQVTTQFSRGQSGPLWDELHPSDQAIVTRARYMTCKSSTGFDLQKITVLATYADTVVVAGKPTLSTAVSIRVTADDGTTTATMHAITLNGAWRWILSPADYVAYTQGKCPSA